MHLLIPPTAMSYIAPILFCKDGFLLYTRGASDSNICLWKCKLSFLFTKIVTKSPYERERDSERNCQDIFYIFRFIPRWDTFSEPCFFVFFHKSLIQCHFLNPETVAPEYVQNGMVCLFCWMPTLTDRWGRKFPSLYIFLTPTHFILAAQLCGSRGISSVPCLP